MKKKLVATALIAVLCIALSATVFTGCEQDNGKTYVSLDINPSVSLILDGNGAVLDVVAENEDAQVLLVDLTLEGKTLEEAVKLVAEASVECGFLSAENSVVDVSVVAENGKAKYESTILGEIERSFSAAATDGGFEIKLNGEGSYTLNRMLEYYKEKYPDNAAVQNMTPAKLDLVLSVTEKDGSISFEAAAQADISSLITMAETAYAEIEPYMTAAYNAAVTEAKLVYENAKAVAESAVWATKYAQFMIGDLDLFAVNYGAVYAAYDVAAITLDYVLDKAEQAADATDAALAQVDTAKLAELLGVEESELKAAVADENGVITLGSIDAYVDRVVKNMTDEAQAAFDDSELKTYLNGLQAEAEEFVNSLPDEYSEKIYDAVKAMEQFGDSAMDFVRELGDLTVDDVRSIVTYFENERDEAMEQIRANLTSEQIAEIEQAVAALNDTLAQAESAFESAVNKAAEDAKAMLAAAKAELAEAHRLEITVD